jgi:hypothetical protein
MGLMVVVPAEVDAAEIKLGVLKCHQVQGSRVNLLIHSTVQVNCLFTSITGKRQAIYKGETGIGLGIDLNWNKSETIAFTVFSANANVGGSHPLAGKYVGVRASVSLGLGAGAQGLVGGGEGQVTLQPLVLESARCFGVAAGLRYLYLEASR